MISNSKGFSYNGIEIGSILNESGNPIKILNVFLENTMYNQKMSGSRSIQEVKIPGRDQPYLYEVDSEPLEFDISIAFEEPLTVTEVRRVARWLLTAKTYKPLIFSKDPDKVFYAVFVGEPSFTYIGQSESGTNTKVTSILHNVNEVTQVILQDVVSFDDSDAALSFNSATGLLTITGTPTGSTATADPDFVIVNLSYEIADEKLIGYMSLKARCNAPTAFAVSVMDAAYINVGGAEFTNNTYQVYNYGDTFVFPDIEIKIPSSLTQSGFTMKSLSITTNWGTSISFSDLQADEKIEIVADMKVIKTDKQSLLPIYPRWNRDELSLEVGNNTLTFVVKNIGGSEPADYSLLNIGFKIGYKSPRFL